MSFFKARTICPKCATEEEVWSYLGQFVPTSYTICRSCHIKYDNDSFLLSLIETQHNVSLSASSLQF